MLGIDSINNKYIIMPLDEPANREIINFADARLISVPADKVPIGAIVKNGEKFDYYKIISIDLAQKKIIAQTISIANNNNIEISFDKAILVNLAPLEFKDVVFGLDPGKQPESYKDFNVNVAGKYPKNGESILVANIRVVGQSSLIAEYEKIVTVERNRFTHTYKANLAAGTYTLKLFLYHKKNHNIREEKEFSITVK